MADIGLPGGHISLDQTNEQGEALSETVADENQARESDSISARENPQEANRRIAESKKLSPVQKKIVDLSFTKIGKLTKNHEFFSLTIWLFVFFGVYLIAIDIVAYVKPVTTTKQKRKNNEQIFTFLQEGKAVLLYLD